MTALPCPLVCGSRSAGVRADDLPSDSLDLDLDLQSGTFIVPFVSHARRL